MGKLDVLQDDGDPVKAAVRGLLTQSGEIMTHNVPAWGGRGRRDLGNGGSGGRRHRVDLGRLSFGHPAITNDERMPTCLRGMKTSGASK